VASTAAAAVVPAAAVHAAAAAVASGATAAAKPAKLAAAAPAGASAKAPEPAAAPLPALAAPAHHHLAALLGRRRRDADRPVAERVALHARERGVALAAVAEAHEAVAARAAGGRVDDDLGGPDRREEGAEGLLEGQVGDLGREVADEDRVVGWGVPVFRFPFLFIFLRGVFGRFFFL